MAKNNNNQGKKKKLDQLQENRQDARIKMYIQLLDVNRDENMTRIYSALQQI